MNQNSIENVLAMAIKFDMVKNSTGRVVLKTTDTDNGKVYHSGAETFEASDIITYKHLIGYDDKTGAAVHDVYRFAKSKLSDEALAIVREAKAVYHARDAIARYKDACDRIAKLATMKALPTEYVQQIDTFARTTATNALDTLNNRRKATALPF